VQSGPANYPYGIYTIPEISFIGTEEQSLTKMFLRGGRGLLP
jgi:pyruvate/2-oxoglutarate dehydrogenase complex dihydrolipoamide dehydrogenase (E3) component